MASGPIADNEEEVETEEASPQGSSFQFPRYVDIGTEYNDLLISTNAESEQSSLYASLLNSDHAGFPQNEQKPHDKTDEQKSQKATRKKTGNRLKPAQKNDIRNKTGSFKQDTQHRVEMAELTQTRVRDELPSSENGQSKKNEPLTEGACVSPQRVMSEQHAAGYKFSVDSREFTLPTYPHHHSDPGEPPKKDPTNGNLITYNYGVVINATHIENINFPADIRPLLTGGRQVPRANTDQRQTCSQRQCEENSQSKPARIPPPPFISTPFPPTREASRASSPSLPSGDTLDDTTFSY